MAASNRLAAKDIVEYAWLSAAVYNTPGEEPLPGKFATIELADGRTITNSDTGMAWTIDHWIKEDINKGMLVNNGEECVVVSQGTADNRDWTEGNARIQTRCLEDTWLITSWYSNC